MLDFSTEVVNPKNDPESSAEVGKIHTGDPNYN